MPPLHVLKVFVASSGDGGNPLGVFLAGPQVPEGERQRVAAELGYSETVYVDDAARAELRIFTPQEDVPFAGHPLVGTALLRREREPVDVLRPRAGEVGVRYDGDHVWIAGRAGWSPDFEYVELGSPDAVDALGEPPGGLDLAYCWAWEDESAGRIRARGLFPRLGIAEDEATGSAALALSARLERPLEIRQGKGSLIVARPLGGDLVEVGGLTELVECRDFEL